MKPSTPTSTSISRTPNSTGYLDPPIPETPHSSLPLDSPLPQVLPLYLAERQDDRLQVKERKDHPSLARNPTEMRSEESSRALVTDAAEMGRHDIYGKKEYGVRARHVSQNNSTRDFGSDPDSKEDRGYGQLELSLPIISPFSATFEDPSNVRKLPDIPRQPSSSSHVHNHDLSYETRGQGDRLGPSDRVERPPRTYLGDDPEDQNYHQHHKQSSYRQHDQLRSEPLASPSNLHLLASPLSIISSNSDAEGKDYFKRPINDLHVGSDSKTDPTPISPGQSEILHDPRYTLGFEHEIGGRLGSGTGSGMSRSGTTTTGSGSRPGMGSGSGSGSGLSSDGTQRRVLLRNESSARQSKGRWEKYLPASKYTRIFLLLVFIETIVDIAIQVYLYLRFDRAVTSQFATEAIKTNQRKFPVYLAIFGLAHLWQMILAIDGAYHRNTIQIIGLSIFNALFLAWAALQISELRTIFKDTRRIDTDGDTSVSEAIYDIPVDALTGTMLGVIAFVEVGLVTLSWFVYKEMGWQIYHDLGADLRIKAYNFHYQIFVCILRFAAFFFAGFGIQFVWLVLYQTKNGEYWATLALLPISMLVLIWGAVAAHKEAHVWMSGFMAALCGAAGYFVYKTIQIYRRKSTFQDVFKSLTIFAVLSIAITVLALFWSLVVMRNFGKGLKRQRERVSLKRKEKRRGRQRSGDNNEMVTVEDAEIEMKRHRMSID